MKNSLLVRKSYTFLLSCLDLIVSFLSADTSKQNNAINGNSNPVLTVAAQKKQTLFNFRKPALAVFAFALMFFIGVQSSWGQGTLSSPVFSENFGTLTNAMALTTSNTAFSYVRVGTSTGSNAIAAKNPSSFTGSSALITAAGGSVSTVDKTGLTSFSRGTFTFKFKTPSSLTGAAIVSAVGAGASFASNNGFTGAQLSAAFQVTGTNLQIRSGGNWLTATTVAVSTSYTVTVVFNNTGSTVTYGSSIPLPTNTVDLWVDGTKIGQYSSATNSLAATAFRIYTTTGSFEVDDVAVYNTLPASTTPAPVISSSLSASGTVGTALTSYTITASNTPTSFTATSLPAGLSFISPTISGTPTAAGTFNTTISATNAGGTDSKTLVFTIAKGTSSITATGTSTYTYNGSAQGPASNTKSGSTGAVTYSYSGTNSTSYAASATAPTVVGTYQVIATVAEDANYNSASSATLAFSITKANSSITATGTTSFAYTGSAQGPSSNNKSGSTGTVTYSYSGTGSTTYAASAIAPTAVGTYQVIATIAEDANYNSATSTALGFSISQKTLTISGLSASNKNYDGNTNATITGTATLVGVVDGDAVSLSGTPVGTFASSAVGLGIAVNVSGYTLTGANAGNYSISQPTNVVLSADIIANTPTLFTSGTIAAVNTTYGSASSSPSTFNVSAQSLTDVITIVAPSGFEVSTSSASGYATSITVGGAGNVASTPVYVRLAATNAVGNYSGNITFDSPGATQVTIATASSNVAQKALTITGLTGVDRVYDGTTTATVTGTATLNGIVGSDDVTLNSTSVTYNFANATAGSTKPITVLGFSLNVTTAGNYSLTQPTGITATINKATSTISVTGATSFTYNNAAQGPSTSSVTGSTGAVTYSYTGIVPVLAASATRPTNVGTYTVAATVATDVNYQAATSTDYSFSITKANQTIIFGTLANAYTNTADFSPGATSATSATNAITYTSSNTSVATIVSNQIHIVGAGTTIITASQASSANYNAATAVAQSLTVDLAPVSLFTNPITGTNPNTSNPYTTGQTVDDSITVNGIGRGSGITSTNANDRYNATGWNSASFDDNKYFEFTLTPKPGKVINFNNFVYTGQASGTGATSFSFRSSLDNFTSSIGTPTAGGTTIVLTNTSYRNITSSITFRLYGYGASGSGGTFSVNDFTFNGNIANIPAPSITSSLTASGSVSTAFSYATTASNSPTSFSATGLPAGLSISTSTGAISGTPTAAGTFDVSLSATNSGGTDTKALAITIAPGNQSITFNTLTSKTYGDTSFNLSGTSSSGLGLTYTSSNSEVATISGNTVTIVGVGSTSITASQSGDSNYNAATNVSQTLTVSAKGLTISVTANNKVYDGSTTATLGTPSYVGLANGESFSVTGTPTATFADANVANGIAVTISGFTAPSPNYTLTQPLATSNITPATLTIEAKNQTVCSGINPSVIISNGDYEVSGYVNSEDASVITGLGQITYSTTYESTSTGAVVINPILTGLSASNYQFTPLSGTITIITTPLVQTAITQSFCNSATVANLQATGTDLKWYSAATGGEVLASNAALSSINYYVSQTLNSCESARTVVAVTIDEASIGILTPAINTVCSGESVLLSLGESIGTVTWYRSLNYDNPNPDLVTWEEIPMSETVTDTSLNTGNMNYSYFYSTNKRWYKAIVTKGLCNLSSNIISVTIISAGKGAKISASPATVCSGSGTTLTLAASSIGKIQWQKSTTSEIADFENVGDLIVPTTEINGVVTLQTGNLSQDTWYRIKFSIGNCAIYSKALKVTVSSSTTVGTLSPLQTTICSGSNAILNLGIGSVGIISWYSSSNYQNSNSELVRWTKLSSTNVALISDASLTTNNLNYSATNPKRWYKVIVTYGACSSTSEIACITINPAVKSKTITASSTIICSGSSTTLKLASGSIGNIQWQKSISSASDGFVNINPINTSTTTTSTNGIVELSTGVLTQDTWFRIKFTNGVCEAFSAAVKVTVSSTAIIGRLTPSLSTICTGTNTNLTIEGTSNGNVTWFRSTNYESSTGAGTWSRVALSDSSPIVSQTSLNTGNLTYSAANPKKWYKAVATIGACSVTSNIVYVTTLPLASATKVNGNSAVKTLRTATCTGSNTSLNLASGYLGTIQWQLYNAGTSATTVNNTSNVNWTDIASATSATYNATSASVGNVWFRAKLTNSPCTAPAYSTPVNIWYKSCSSSKTTNSNDTMNPKPQEQIVVATPFDVVVYPNPSDSTFQFNFTTTSENLIEMRVYDMIGKLVEVRQFSTTEMNNQEVGNNYASGVYNVIVTQGEEMKTLRVIKK